MKRAPLPLSITAIAYVAFEAWTLFSEPSATVAVRFVLTLVLFYFVLRGSRAAGFVLAACSAGAALVSAYAVAKFPMPYSIWFGVAGLVCAALTTYVLFSPAVRKFQSSRGSPPAAAV